MNKEIIKQSIIEQNESFNKDFEKIITRTKLEYIKSIKDLPHIIIISGLRRAGKSTFLKEINKEFYNKEFSYLNFEDEKLFNFDVKEFNLIYETFLELDSNQKTIFLDEIQNVDNWEIAIRRLYENNIKFYLTGSNALMLSKELGTKLTGRHINITLFPFSFEEFLKFNNFEFEKKDFYISQKKSKLKNLFEKYIKLGGIPEFLKYERKEIIEGIYNDILYKDILVRYKLSDERSLKELAKYLLSNVGKEFSYNKLKKSLDFGSLNTVKNYISYLENSYLIFSVEKYDNSLKKQLIANKKVYSIDTSFINNVSFKISEDYGRILENVVFIELKRREKEIYYHKDNKECDFVIRDGLNIVEAIQVTKNLSSEETKKREIEGLIEAMNKYKLKNGLILTDDEENEFIIENKKIIVKPIWKWLLEK